MEIACLDLEGVLVPEIWIAFAEETGIESLRATTRPVLPNQHEREGRWWWEEATHKECGLHAGNLIVKA